MRIGTTNVDLSSFITKNEVVAAFQNSGCNVESASESRISLISSSSLSPDGGEEEAAALKGRLKTMGYDQFAVRFNQNANKIEIIDGKALEDNLSQWAGEEHLSSKEVHGRRTATQRIKEAFYNNASNLSLHNLKLSSIPDAIGAIASLEFLHLEGNKLQTLPASIGSLTNLKYLDLYGNQLQTLPASISALANLQCLKLDESNLQTLPDWIGALANLIFLFLDNNQLQTLPASISALANLRELILDGNQLQTLPESIGALANLRELLLDGNQLQTLPESIGALANLLRLDLDDNQLQTLPASIGSLANLKFLLLDDNQLQSLPASIGSLANLQELGLNRNPNLADLPLALGQCSLLTNVETDQTAIPIDQVSALRAVCQARRNAEASHILPDRLRAWKAASGQEFSLDFIQKMETEEKQIIEEWLTRLEKTKDFNSRCQKGLAEIACSMLRSLGDNPVFKEIFFNQVPLNNERCGDRAAMGFNELFLAWKLATLPASASEEEKFHLMMQAAKTAALRQALQNRISLHESKTGANLEESVEIYLYYETALKERLDLLTAISGMLYGSMGRRHWISEADLIEEVRMSFLDHLSDFALVREMVKQEKDWKTMQENFADRLSNLDTEKDEGKINEGTYLEKTYALKKEREKGEKDFAKTWVKNKLNSLNQSSSSSSTPTSSKVSLSKDEMRYPQS